ncbi:MAG: glycosyltransferase family 4 protein [Glaciimonas sp.]|nr:glycosyltransferase family 4 protein [Glaciimonas sp.]
MIYVGFIFAFQDEKWLGGINYYKNLLRAISSLPDSGRKIEPIIFTGFNINSDFLAKLPPFKIVRTRLLDRLHPAWIVRKIIQRTTGCDWLFEKILNIHGVQVLSHHESLGHRSRILTIGWISDFQHRHLPDFFSQEEINHRNYAHHELCAGSDTVVVSSNNAKTDILNFIPESSAKVRVLQFAADANIDIAQPGIADIEEKYGFIQPYFHLPNQFWIHKNHIVVINALKLLKERNIVATVLVTGNTSDFRQPEHFNNLVRKVKEYGLEDNFRILGLLPSSDLLVMMKNAVALINPSLFEGWSTTVEEAKMLGKIIILSDIAVHKEQAPKGGVFFSKDDPVQLAQLMSSVLTDWRAAGANHSVPNADTDAKAAMINFGNSYQDIVLEVVRDVE